jgi:protein-S-isoprenylcysteine O-methyltransferase Ste14
MLKVLVPSPILVWKTLLMKLSARILQTIWIGSLVAGMFFFVIFHSCSEGYLPESPEAWLFFLLGWSFVVVAAISAGFYMKRRACYALGSNDKGELREGRKENVLMIILGAAFFLNIVAINLIPPIIEELVALGYVIFGIGAAFYILSVLTLRMEGVSRVADSGIYGIVRHPMYLGAIIMFFSHIFLGQNWIVAIGAITAIVCCSLIILSDEDHNLQKYGDDYKRYMKKVLGINFILGIVRLQRK